MKEFAVEHHIQRDIIQRLSVAKTLRFSELKPVGMESNIFMYHLNQLLKSGHVVKQDKKYTLGLQGLRYVDNIISSVRFMPAHHPKPLTIIVLHNNRGELLMTLRRTQPYIDTYMFLSGKQHFGEDSMQHAHRELQEKVGLQGIALRRAGLIDYRIRDAQGEVITHILGHVHVGEYNGPAPKSWTERYAFEWYAPSELAGLNVLAGTLELQQLLQNHPHELFFDSRDFLTT